MGPDTDAGAAVTSLVRKHVWAQGHKRVPDPPSVVVNSLSFPRSTYLIPSKSSGPVVGSTPSVQVYQSGSWHRSLQLNPHTPEVLIPQRPWMCGSAIIQPRKYLHSPTILPSLHGSNTKTFQICPIPCRKGSCHACISSKGIFEHCIKI